MTEPEKITAAQIENKLRELAQPVEERAEQAKSMAVVGAVAIGALLVISAYLAGRRKGKKRTPVIEIRRI